MSSQTQTKALVTTDWIAEHAKDAGLRPPIRLLLKECTGRLYSERGDTTQQALVPGTVSCLIAHPRPGHGWAFFPAVCAGAHQGHHRPRR